MNRDESIATDAALVHALAARSEAALEALYRRHAPAVHALARRVLGDRSVADDVVQDVFVRLWSEPTRFDPERGTLRSLLLMWAHRYAVDLLRSECARRARESRDAMRLRPPIEEVEAHVMDLDLAQTLDRELAVLRGPQRRAIELAYLDGLTYREVARELDEPEGTVKSRIRAALLALRTAMSPLGLDQAEVGKPAFAERYRSS